MTAHTKLQRILSTVRRDSRMASMTSIRLSWEYHNKGKIIAIFLIFFLQEMYSMACMLTLITLHSLLTFTRMIWAASTAMSVPVPMATPISAIARAGESLIPSPTIATCNHMHAHTCMHIVHSYSNAHYSFLFQCTLFIPIPVHIIHSYSNAQYYSYSSAHTKSQVCTQDNC